MNDVKEKKKNKKLKAVMHNEKGEQEKEKKIYNSSKYFILNIKFVSSQLQEQKHVVYPTYYLSDVLKLIREEDPSLENRDISIRFKSENLTDLKLTLGAYGMSKDCFVHAIVEN